MKCPAEYADNTGMQIRHPGLACGVIALLCASSVIAQHVAAPRRAEKQDAETAILRPAAAQRVVAKYDFEEPAVYNTPRYWRRLTTNPTEEDAEAAPPLPPGFPKWNEPMLEVDGEGVHRAHGGAGSVRLATKGGHTGIRLDAGVIPVFPGAEYLVSAMVRLEGLKSARPSIAARYLDRENRPIASTEVRLVGTHGPGVAVHAPADRHQESDDGHEDEHTDREREGWERMTISIAGGPADAAYLQIDLLLLQPTSGHDPHAMGHAGDEVASTPDLSGAARFDDVTVVQLPRVTLTVGRPEHCFVAPEAPVLALRVRDLAGEALACEMRLWDVRGREVDFERRPILGGTAEETWKPRLPAVDGLGWYRATVDLVQADTGGRVGSTYADFCVLGPESDLSAFGRARLTDRERFGVLIGSLDAPLGATAGLSRLTGAGMAVVPMWEPWLAPELMRAHVKSMEGLVAAIANARQSVWLNVNAPPLQLAALTRDRGTLDEALALGETEWGPYVLPVTDRFGASVQKWLVGDAWDEPSWSSVPNSLAMRAIDNVIPGAATLRVTPGWMGSSSRDAQAIVARQESSPEAVGMMAGDLLASPAGPDSMAGDASDLERTTGRPPAALVLGVGERQQDRDGGSIGRSDAAAMLARSMIEAWRAWSEKLGDSRGAGAPSMLIAQPWRVDGPGVPRAMPTPSLAVWRTVSQQLAGRRVVGKLDLAPGIEGWILRPIDPDGLGAIVAWRTTAAARDSMIDADLGEGTIEAVDIFGNRAAVRRGGEPVAVGFEPPITGVATDVAKARERARGSSTKTHRVWVSESPVFLEGVDVSLAMFIAGFKVEPAVLSMFQRDHAAAIVVPNTWQVPIEGRLRIVEPGGLSQSGQRDRGWVISPRVIAFSLAPGETAKLPVQVAFSPSEEAGIKNVVAEVELTAERIYEPFRVRAPLELGLDTIELTLESRLLPDPIKGPDAEVRVQVVNRDDEPLSMEFVAWAEGFPRGKASASKVPPGGVVLRRFFFADGAIKLGGQRVTVGVEDVQTRARLTRSVAVE